MGLPSREEIKIALLAMVRNRKEYELQDAIVRLARRFRLTEAELDERYASGRPKFENAVGWAKKTLILAGDLKSTRRGAFMRNH
jgi:restriction endonuclease Mrr